MAGTRRGRVRVSTRGLARDRHGRGIRAAVTGPYLPLLRSRANVFETTVASTAEYLKELWPDELSGVAFDVAALPAHLGETEHGASGLGAAAGVERWRVLASEHRVILYRVPIERLSRLHSYDDLHRRMMIESCVFRAVAELIGKDPWDLAPDRYRHL